MQLVIIQPFQAADIEEMVIAFQLLGWNKPRTQFEKYLSEQEHGKRTVFIARTDGKFAGYATLVWNSEYPSFAIKNIPEVKDLNVLPKYRKQGIGQKLMESCEEIARKHDHNTLGLGVGLIFDYGSAQRLYFRLNYFPDGAGLHYGIQSVAYSQKVVADDDLVLYLCKSL